VATEASPRQSPQAKCLTLEETPPPATRHYGELYSSLLPNGALPGRRSAFPR